MLLQSGEEQRLIAEGPCRLGDWIPKEVKSLIRSRYPFARRLEEDIASEVLLSILGSEKLCGSGRIRHFVVLERRLREMMRSRVIDALRHHGLVARMRCGSCVHFERGSPPGCGLALLPGIGEADRPNPWRGDAVDRGSDPRRLAPPCAAFRWRRPETHDIFEEEIPGVDASGTARERAASLLVQGIDRISRQGESGMKVAAVLFWHYLRGKEVAALAEESAVSEKTIKRMLKDGRERLQVVLRDELGEGDSGELL